MVAQAFQVILMDIKGGERVDPSEPPEEYVKNQELILPPPHHYRQFLMQQVENGSKEPAFLTGSQVILMLLVPGPHFENN